MLAALDSLKSCNEIIVLPLYPEYASAATGSSINPEYTATTFQSRLGKTPWIQPYTDDALKQLAKKGIKKLLMVCASFVTDCLETLEEINIRAKQQWMNLGGEKFTLVPSLNSSAMWVEAIAKIINPSTDEF